MSESKHAAGAAPSVSLWGDAWRRLKKNKMATWCGGIVIFITLFCIVGPWIAEFGFGIDPIAQEFPKEEAPSWRHWFGTDGHGRDVLVRTMIGGRLALMVGVSATVVALLVGVTWGAVSAYAGGKVDEVMMRIVDVLYAFPTVVFVIVIQAMFGVRSLFILFVLIGAISWLNMARIVRGQVMSIRAREFVEAAKALGVPTRTIIFRHIIPNTLGPIIVYSTLSLPSVMLTEAFLSYLGLGVQAPLASWGTLVNEGSLLLTPWTLIGPGLVMSTTIFALNFLGDGLRDALDPHMRKH